MRNALALIAFFALSASAGAAEEPLSIDGLRSPDPAVRAATRDAIRAAGEEALPVLEEGIRSDDPLVSAAAADLAGELSLRPARAALVERIRTGRADSLPVRAACRALGAVGDGRDVPLLLERARTVPEAALALARLGEPDAAGPLAGMLGERDVPPEVAYAAAVLGSDAGLAALVADLRREDRRSAALRWLRAATGADPGPEPADWDRWWRRRQVATRLADPDWDASEQALDEVRAALRDGPEAERRRLVDDLLAIARDAGAERYARTKAILALGLAGPSDAAAPLVTILETDEDPQVRLYAAEALGRLGVPETAVNLAAYLIDDEEPFRKLSAREENVRYYTIDSEVSKALVRMGFAGGLDYMIRQLHENRRIRVYHEAIRLLRLVSGGLDFGYEPDASWEAKIAAADRWRDWFDENRSDLVLAEGVNHRDPALVARIRDLVDRMGGYKFLYMWRARETLVLLGEAALPELLAGLGRPEAHIRVGSAEVLGRIHAKRARGALAALLTNPDELASVRRAAAAALAEMGPGDAVGHVVEALSDPDPNVRIEAARGLAKADFARAVPALRRALESAGDAAPAFRRELLYALGAHGDAGAVDALAGMLDHPDVAFRTLVADRLEALTRSRPGLDPASVEAWRKEWEVSRDRYTGRGAAGSRR